jgi:hypothetical protein
MIQGFTEKSSAGTAHPNFHSKFWAPNSKVTRISLELCKAL